MCPFLLSFFLEKIAFVRACLAVVPSREPSGLSARPVEILQLNCLKDISVMIFALFARDT